MNRSTRPRFQKSRIFFCLIGFILVLMVILGAVDSTNVMAASKDLSLLLKNAEKDNNGNILSNGKEVKYLLKAYGKATADCTHVAIVIDEDPVSFDEGVLNIGMTATDPQWWGAGKFSPTLEFIPLKAEAPHPTIGTTISEIYLWVHEVNTEPIPTNPPNYFYYAVAKVDSESTTIANAEVPGVPPLFKDIAQATATSWASAKVKGSTARGINSAQKANAKANAKKKGQAVTGTDGPNVGTIKTTATKGSWQGPVVATFTDVLTGEEFSETLLDLQMEGSAVEEETWEYDFSHETGVFLAATGDGSSSITGAANSSWLDNPYGEFGATLSDGSFTATGVWETLSWDLGYDEFGGVISAYLSEDNLSDDLDFTPIGLQGDADYELSLEWDSSDSDEAYSVASIPEPASIALLGLGALALLRRQLV